MALTETKRPLPLALTEPVSPEERRDKGDGRTGDGKEALRRLLQAP
ncbi:hypothetical protein AAEO56_11435 [Flavobacterium sp. DGU11]|uniref:Uncharacterized protein n=1 Tax=Flavobacterium arundinis TaxID=3139143 RepID=A0ABU9HXI5_9FLAO